jgi:hypothetical protein
MITILPTAESSADALLDHARASVKVTGSGSVSRLQQDLGLGYGIASVLADSLEEEGTLLAPHGDRPRMLHPRFLRQHVRDVSAAARPRYVNRLVALSLFFFECYEEGHVGDSRIPGLLSPVAGLPVRVMRDLFLVRWYGDQQLSMGQAALAFHAHLVDSGRTELAEAGIADSIALACVQHARKPISHLSKEDRIDRAHLRLARCYRHMLSDGVGRESRVIEWYVPNEYVARGVSRTRSERGLAEGAHEEHVVPCAFIRDTALRYLSEGCSLDDVVRMTKRLLTIIDITELERALLDDGADALRHVMPSAWDPVNGCIFARLHVKLIALSNRGIACACPPDQKLR